MVSFKEDIEDEEINRMGSWNHAFIQSRLTKLLPDDEKFTPLVELSLDISQVDLSQFHLKVKEELKPDICLYPAKMRGLSKPFDIFKMSEMPVLIIEILSPKQGMNEIIAKFQLYFALGIQSCWLVVPAIEVITVYSSLDHFKSFDQNDAEVVDHVLDIRLPFQLIFLGH